MRIESQNQVWLRSCTSTSQFKPRTHAAENCQACMSLGAILVSLSRIDTEEELPPPPPGHQLSIGIPFAHAIGKHGCPMIQYGSPHCGQFCTGKHLAETCSGFDADKCPCSAAWWQRAALWSHLHVGIVVVVEDYPSWASLPPPQGQKAGVFNVQLSVGRKASNRQLSVVLNTPPHQSRDGTARPLH